LQKEIAKKLDAALDGERGDTMNNRVRNLFRKHAYHSKRRERAETKAAHYTRLAKQWGERYLQHDTACVEALRTVNDLIAPNPPK
jgi:hypothetical protein